MKVYSINKAYYSNKNTFSALRNLQEYSTKPNDFSLQNGYQNIDSNLLTQSFRGYVGIDSKPQKISFGSNKNKKTQDPVLDFGVSLYKKLKSNYDLDITKEIRDFLDQNGMEDVQIKDLKEATVADDYTMGGFSPEYSNDLGYAGGTLYINKNMTPSNPKTCATITAFITHELSHAYKHKEDNGIELFREAGIKQSELSQIMLGFITFLSQQGLESKILNTPIQYAIKNYEKVGLNRREAMELVDDISKYRAIFPHTSAKISEKTILKALTKGKSSLEDVVAKNFKEVISSFNSIPETEPYRDMETYKLLQRCCVYCLRDEAEAYKKNSQIIKLYSGLSRNTKTLNDLAPMSYNAIANALEKVNIEDLCETKQSL